MASRLSTAYILAAARAADGVPPKSPPPDQVAPGLAPGNAEARPPRNGVISHPPHEAAGAKPRSMSEILSKVKGEREQSESFNANPPSIHAILEAVQGGSEARPASIASVLVAVRQFCGTQPAADQVGRTASQKTTRPPNLRDTNLAEVSSHGADRGQLLPMSSNKRSTAEILAAARQQGAPRVNSTSNSSGLNRSQRAVSRNGENPRQALSPESATASDGKPRPRSVVSLLEAARSEAKSAAANRKYPDLLSMVQELRRADRRSQPNRLRPESDLGWFATVKRWFSDAPDSHQGASI